MVVVVVIAASVSAADPGLWPPVVLVILELDRAE